MKAESDSSLRDVTPPPSLSFPLPHPFYPPPPPPLSPFSPRFFRYPCDRILHRVSGSLSYMGAGIGDTRNLDI